MCFLFLDGEFSATALLSETARIKNTHRDGALFYVVHRLRVYVVYRRDP